MKNTDDTIYMYYNTTLYERTPAPMIATCKCSTIYTLIIKAYMKHEPQAFKGIKIILSQVANFLK